MSALRAFSCLSPFLLPGTGSAYARFPAFRLFYCPDRDCPTRVFLPSAFSTARTGHALRAFFCFPLFLLPGPGTTYARFSASRLFYCTDRDCPTRVFLPSAFSTARTGPALRAFFCLLLFLLHGPGPAYARFSAFRFFYCPDRARPYARFHDFLLFYCPDRARPTRVFLLSLFLLPGPGTAYARFTAFRLFYCPDRAGVTRVFLSSAFSTARTGTGPGRGPASSN